MFTFCGSGGQELLGLILCSKFSKSQVAKSGFSKVSGGPSGGPMLMSLELKKHLMILFQNPESGPLWTMYMDSGSKKKVRPCTPYLGY